MADPLLAVRIEGLRFRYPDGTQALRGLNLSVGEGERLAVLGANGAGKSTLLLHLNGLLRGSGEVQVLGLAVARPHLQTIRRQVGLVFQNPDDQLFMPSVFDEAAYAAVNAGYSRAEVRRRVQAALAVTGLEGLESRHPQNLSLGQKKRLTIASVLVTDNRLLVLDEPSAGLDPAARDALIALLGALPQTMVIATHDLPFAAAVCQRAVTISDGVIVGEAPL